jgi:hypothetical protein
MVCFWRSLTGYQRVLIIIYLLTLPFVHARVLGDGEGYYAYLRSPLIDHDLQFAGDWHSAPLPVLRECTVCSAAVKQEWNDPNRPIRVFELNQHFYANPITKTGHLPNFYSVGPAILWAPFVIASHVAVLAADRLGAHIAADGRSWPYIATLSGATALYGFLGLWLSFLLARKYVDDRWAFWAVVAIWFASSLPLGMYLEPSWSHALSAFCVALFLWYWDRTRDSRTPMQWAVLGLTAGLMIDVYLANGVFFLAPAFDCVMAYWSSWRDSTPIWSKLRSHIVFAASVIFAFSPMLITRAIVFGNPLALGMYVHVPWNWKSPTFLPILFSHNHGLFICTPILLLAVLGLAALARIDRRLGAVCAAMTLAFYLLISVYPWWFGTVSFGNRFFISLTPVFILGIAAAFSWIAGLWSDGKIAARRLVPVTTLLILWNLGLLYQYSTFMFFPDGVGQVSWSEVTYNQFRVVPEQVVRDISAAFTFTRRPELEHASPAAPSQPSRKATG